MDLNKYIIPGSSKEVQDRRKVLDCKAVSRIHRQINHGKQKLLQKYRIKEENPTKKFKMDESSSGFSPEIDKKWERRPAGLKGREIGLWYRDRARALGKSQGKKNKEDDKNVKNRLNISVSLSSNVITEIKEVLHKHENKEVEFYSTEFQKFFNSTLKTSFDEYVRCALSNSAKKVPDDEMDCNLLSELEMTESSLEFKNILKTRVNLPIFDKRDEIINTMLQNQVILISGDTGCGKTTQIPQFILDFHIKNKMGSICNVVCTQPRRISAITVSERVAWERVEKIGKSVGYQIRLENVLPRKRGSILYCTTGTLLRQMEGDPLLANISHIILDEIHERTVETDILMALLKKICPLRKDLKVILMSATFCTEDFSRYFDNCPIIRVSGMLFPVEEKYLEDVLEEINFDNFSNSEKRYSKDYTAWMEAKIQFNNIIQPYVKAIKYKYSQKTVRNIANPNSETINIDLLCELVFHISMKKPDGAILVFLPGYDKISNLYTKITESKFYKSSRFLVFPLHSRMATADQKLIFDRPPPGVRKVILATNIAETSITIDDVVYVINAGKLKAQDYDIERNFQTLGEQWVTLANAKQRKGRAGRVQPGICYHLYTRARERILDDYPTPEVLRTKLDGIILNMKLLRINDVRQFFKTLVDVPNSTVVENSMNLLKRINAIDENEFITPLGLHLARLPLDPQVGKMILMASIFKCVGPILSCAASLSFKDAFYIPLGKEKQVERIKLKFANGSKSDHLMFANISEELKEAKERQKERKFCYDNFLSLSTLNQLEKMKKQFCDILEASRFLPSSNPRDARNNLNSFNENLLRAIICAGLYPNVAFLKKSKVIKRRARAVHTIFTPNDERVQFHPSSVNSNETGFDSSFFVYHMKQKSTSLYLHDTTMVHPIALIIFGDTVKTGVNDFNKHYISVADEYAFECNEETSKILLELREGMESLLQKKALHPGPTEDKTSEDDLLKAIIFLLNREAKKIYTGDSDEFDTDDGD